MGLSRGVETTGVIAVRRIVIATVTAAVTGVGLCCAATAATAAPATVVHCGQVVTTSIQLANNLSNCHGNGLIVGANNITINLAGHSITGTNAPGSEGIADDGHGGAKIQNGTIQRFFLNGVGLRGAPNSTVSNMTISGIGAGGTEPTASAGVLVKNSPYTSVVGNKVTNHVAAFQSDGVDVLFSGHTTVQGNTLAANNWDGLVVIQSPASRVIANTLESNGNQGMELNAGADRSVVSGNYAARNASNGLVVGAVSGVQIQNNMLWGNPDNGLFMFDIHGSVISHNRAGGNGGGIDLEGGQFGSSNNQIATNDTSRNVFVGIVVAEGANHNLVTGNTSDSNRGAPGQGGGIIIFAAVGNTVRANAVVGNSDVGIGVFQDQPGDTKNNVLAGNFAVNNHAHGIDAAVGAIDGGGNIARGNTPPPQCIGVVCKPA
jgi:hypothetical protein